MNIKNLKINDKKLKILFGTGVILFTLTSCGIDTSGLTYNDILSNPKVQEITVLDDERETSDSVKDNLDDVSKLEIAIELYDLDNDITYAEVDSLIPLSDEEKEETLKLDIDEIKELNTISKSKDTDLLSTENRLIAIKKLAYLKDYYKDFLNTDGLVITEKFLKNCIKGSIANEFGCSSDVVFIGSMPSKDLDYLTFTVDGTDYIVKTSNETLWNGTEYVYSIQMANPNHMSEKDIKDTCVKGLHYGYDITLKGCSVKDNKIVERYSDKFVRKNILSK